MGGSVRLVQAGLRASLWFQERRVCAAGSHMESGGFRFRVGTDGTCRCARARIELRAAIDGKWVERHRASQDGRHSIRTRSEPLHATKPDAAPICRRLREGHDRSRPPGADVRLLTTEADHGLEPCWIVRGTSTCCVLVSGCLAALGSGCLGLAWLDGRPGARGLAPGVHPRRFVVSPSRGPTRESRSRGPRR
jgi:hypothetical protein